MSIFGFGKKDKNACECGGNCGDTIDNDAAFIKVLGTGCKKCIELENNAKQAVENLKNDMSVGHITDIQKIAQYGVMSAPALVIGDKVVSYGKVLKISEIEKLLV